jgi:hypothetical protein
VLWTVLGIALLIRTGVRDRGVIADHLEFGRRLLQGLDLYAPHLDPYPLHPPYPPTFGLLTAPFSLLPERLARFAWGLLQLGALYAIGRSLRSLLTHLAPALKPHLNLLLLTTALLTSRYILRDTHGGGGNLINLALCLLAYTSASTSPRTSGLLLGISLATKPTYILLLPLFWLFGFRRAVGWAMSTTLALGLVSLCLLRLDLHPWATWIQGTLAYASMPDLFATPDLGFPPFTWMNQCLRCMVARYLGTVPPDLAQEVPGFFSGLGWPPSTTAWIARLLNLGLLLTTFAAAFRSRLPSHRPLLLAATITHSLLLSPISWKAHLVALIPAFFLLLLYGAQKHRWIFLLATLYILTCSLGEEILGKDTKNLQQSLYVFTVWNIILWALCLRLVFKIPPPAPSGPQLSQNI